MNKNNSYRGQLDQIGRIIQLYSLNKMRAKMNSHEIYQYLMQKNFNLTSDKILKQPHLNYDIIWNILVFLATPIKNTKFEQIEPMLYVTISPALRDLTIKKIKEYVIVSDSLKKILRNNQEYPIKEIMKPDREWLMDKINALISANKYYEKTSKEQENFRTEIKLKRQLVHDLKRKYEAKNVEIQEVKALKEKQKALHEEKVQAMENLNKEWSYKKKEKLDLMNSQQQLDNELKKKSKLASENSYHNDDLNIKIKQLERQVIRNAPKLKKERYALIEQYEKMVVSNKNQIDQWSTKIASLIQKIKMSTNLREKTKTTKIENKFKQVELLASQLSQVGQLMSQDQQCKQESSGNKKQLLRIIQNIQKSKKQLIESCMQEQRQASLLSTSQKMLKEEGRQHASNVKVLEDRNSQSLAQYKALSDKIKFRSDRVRQLIFEATLRFKNLESESKQIIEDAFTQFN